MSDINLQGEVIYPACQECKRLRAQLDAARAFAELHGHVMGRIAIELFGEQNNRTDEECITRVAEVVHERDSLRQHLHDEHQRHIGTMDERDALAALLRECREDWIRLAYGASHEDVAAYRDFATRIDAALAKDKP